MKKLIIFDFDGVIIDSWKHSYEMNLREWPDLKPEQHKKFFNGNIHEEIAKLGPSIKKQEDTDKWMEEVYFPTKNNLPIFSGIDEIIKNLAPYYRLVINTSADAKSTKDFLIKNNIDFFYEIYGTEISKDKKIKFTQILTDYQANGEDVIFITDTVGDVLVAKDFDMKILVVTYGYQNRQSFNGMENMISSFIDTPSDILNHL
jgi:phosphoglycolate phosphatase